MFNSTLSPGQTLIHLLMMHLHSEHFLSVRIRNRVLWQRYDFLAWLHKLYSAISLNLSEWGFSNFYRRYVFIRSTCLAPLCWKSHGSKTSRSLPCVQDDITVPRMHHAAHVTREVGWNLPSRVLSTQVRASPPWASHQSPWCSDNQIVRACASSTAHRRAQGNLRERELPRFVARLTTVQALRSLIIQVLELHRLGEIGVPYQVYLSTPFTSLYFLLMSCIRFD